MNSARERENWLSRGTHTLTRVQCTSVHQPVTEKGSQDHVFTDVRKHKQKGKGDLEKATEETG